MTPWWLVYIMTWVPLDLICNAESLNRLDNGFASDATKIARALLISNIAGEGRFTLHPFSTQFSGDCYRTTVGNFIKLGSPHCGLIGMKGVEPNKKPGAVLKRAPGNVRLGFGPVTAWPT